jgi:catechol 2,3-dioxygenase-like lactoylglutathione lyase family enzyme
MGELRVVRHTDRFEDGCRFYGEILGWPVTKQWDDPEPGRIFGYGESARVELLAVGPDEADSTGGLIAVEVDDAAAVHDALHLAGVEIRQPLTEQPWGHRNFGVVDPTGLTVVLFEVIE